MTVLRGIVAAVLVATQAGSTGTRVGPLTTRMRPRPLASSPRTWDDSNYELTSICTGVVDLQSVRIKGIPRLESDATQEDGPWSLGGLSSGLPCDFAVSDDGVRSVALVMTGHTSYYVLFFEREVLVRAQMIHGPWNLCIYARERFPPSLEQPAEGDAGFLYSFDEQTGLYRAEPYPYPEGYEMEE